MNEPEIRAVTEAREEQHTNSGERFIGGSLAVSLVLLARLHGRRISTDAVLAGLPLENGMLTPSCFSRAAEKAGLVSHFVRTPFEGINPLLCPSILLLEGARSCVLISFDSKERKAVAIFPELQGGETEVSFDDLSAQYSGYVIYVRPVFKFDERSPKSETEPKKKHWFWDTIAVQKPLYRDIIIASVLSNIFAFAMPLFVMNVYNRIVPNNAIDSLWVMALGVFIMISADFVLQMSRGYLVDVAAARTNTKLSGEMMEQVLGMKADQRPATAGSMVNSIQGFESVRNFISSATVFAYVDLPFAVFFFAVIAIIAWPLAVPLFIAAILILLHAVLIQKQMRELSETTNRAASLKNSTLVESLIAMETLKTQGAEGRMQNRWEKTVRYLEDTNVKLHLLSSSVMNWTQWVQLTVSIATMVIGVYLIRDNAISMGSLIAAYMLSSRAMMPVSRVAGLLMQYYSTSRSLTALDEIMNKETEHSSGTYFVSRPDIKGGIEFKNVSFTYPGQEKQALSSVSFRIMSGEKVAFIGAIGSGKTTITKLLLKLYQPQEGTILIDGIDSGQIDPVDLRRNIGAVPQEAVLFFGTLRENILIGNPQAGDMQMLGAAHIGGTDIFANLHPKGFDMQVGERGCNLSSGQREAVAISRAVIKNPNILVLDEPTASMDSANENLVCKNIEAISKDKTIVVITHRAALLELVSRIIVIDNGRVVADGPKDKVIAALQQGQIRKGV